MIHCRHSQSLSQRSDLTEGGRYTPFTSLRCREVAVSGAICLKPRVRPTHHYLYHYSYPRLSISAAATYLADRHNAWPAEWQRGMYSIAVEVGTRLPAGFV